MSLGGIKSASIYALNSVADKNISSISWAARSQTIIPTVAGGLGPLGECLIRTTFDEIASISLKKIRPQAGIRRVLLPSLPNIRHATKLGFSFSILFAAPWEIGENIYLSLITGERSGKEAVLDAILDTGCAIGAASTGAAVGSLLGGACGLILGPVGNAIGIAVGAGAGYYVGCVLDQVKKKFWSWLF